MLLPQARVGMGERRRPDFVVFIPVHFWNYRKLAIQLDCGHSPDQDITRNKCMAEHGYETMSLRPGAVGCLGELRRLVEHIDTAMRLYESDTLAIATETRVRMCTLPAEPL
jgi:hypothetical protein